jgi:hypothetical protein
MIYARRGSTITVRVINPSPFESLSLDFKTATDAPPTDSFQSFFASQSGNLGKISALFVKIEAYVPPGGVPSPEEQDSTLHNQLAAIFTGQATLLSEIDLTTVFTEIAKATLPPTPGICDGVITNDTLGYPDPWLSTAQWQAQVVAQLKLGQSGMSLSNTNVKNQIDTLSGQLKKLEAAHFTDIPPLFQLAQWMNDLVTAQKNQETLSRALATRVDPVGEPTPASNITNQLIVLEAAIGAIQTPVKDPVPSYAAKDISPRDSNTTTESWGLDFQNTLANVVKANAGAPQQAANPLAVLTNQSASPPPSLMTINVQYEKPPRLEFATGVMVPGRPFHSYSAAALATNGVATGNVVQQTLTYTVVPLALVNIVLRQGNLCKQPVAFFATIGTGYNPATSSVEFGVGPSFSWRSIMISGLADIGRDTQLAGGFTVGEALPASNPPKPLTTIGWFVKPAIALSVRIPLGGGGK